jgi:putative endonuclease
MTDGQRRIGEAHSIREAAMRLHIGERTERNALYRRHQRRPAPVWEHRHAETVGFTGRYGVTDLVYVEFHDEMPAAILREKQMKKWRRAWKLQLIEKDNPGRVDLYDQLAG